MIKMSLVNIKVVPNKKGCLSAVFDETGDTVTFNAFSLSTFHLPLFDMNGRKTDSNAIYFDGCRTYTFLDGYLAEYLFGKGTKINLREDSHDILFYYMKQLSNNNKGSRATIYDYKADCKTMFPDFILDYPIHNEYQQEDQFQSFDKLKAAIIKQNEFANIAIKRSRLFKLI